MAIYQTEIPLPSRIDSVMVPPVVKCQKNPFSISALEHKLALQEVEIASLRSELARHKLDLQTINEKYVAEIERAADIQHEKDLAERELEELSCRLFEEANSMVATERRTKWQLERRLQQTQEHLIAEQSQLQELRQRLEQQCVEPAHATVNSAFRFPSVVDDAIEAKGLQFDKFCAFVRPSSQTNHKRLGQFPYVQDCQIEDIEPCLRFGARAQRSIKELIEHLERQPCFIEHIGPRTSTESLSFPVLPPAAVIGSQQERSNQYYDHATMQLPLPSSLWGRFSSPQNPTTTCSVCGQCSSEDQQVFLNYRFRLNEQDEWVLIDEQCRNRLVAVCEFYVFLRNIQMGHYGDHSIGTLYSESIRLRLHMFYSRTGAWPTTPSEDHEPPVGKASSIASLDASSDDGSEGSSIATTGSDIPMQTKATATIGYRCHSGDAAWAMESLYHRRSVR
ncbi:uncharacterized protein BYT42DRAFT_564704 [Radiomyces spectabilis]|uniref:uncharacterized protein n=1 Tax=Radiomyces spectabilis TaxID=64574 RepID=UPI0022208D3F|nr:uncharacterized protein BYT42DRAFT_564704 [Radiomyces spectabilis]KAI8380929.1 hypothetical protein BYT42DRAFT_564704 [Radiomyces spectabilis]